MIIKSCNLRKPHHVVIFFAKVYLQFSRFPHCTRLFFLFFYFLFAFYFVSFSSSSFIFFFLFLFFYFLLLFPFSPLPPVFFPFYFFSLSSWSSFHMNILFLLLEQQVSILHSALSVALDWKVRGVNTYVVKCKLRIFFTRLWAISSTVTSWSAHFSTNAFVEVFHLYCWIYSTRVCFFPLYCLLALSSRHHSVEFRNCCLLKVHTWTDRYRLH